MDGQLRFFKDWAIKNRLVEDFYLLLHPNHRLAWRTDLFDAKRFLWCIPVKARKKALPLLKSILHVIGNHGWNISWDRYSSKIWVTDFYSVYDKNYPNFNQFYSIFLSTSQRKLARTLICHFSTENIFCLLKCGYISKLISMGEWLINSTCP